MDPIKQSLVEKLHPNRFSGMSSKMAALVGCILGEKFTDPYLIEMTVSSDGMMLARRHDDCGFNEFIGANSDFERNWTNLLNAAKLTPEEWAMADSLKKETVKRH